MSSCDTKLYKQKIIRNRNSKNNASYAIFYPQYALISSIVHEFSQQCEYTPWRRSRFNRDHQNRNGNAEFENASSLLRILVSDKISTAKNTKWAH